VDKEKHLSSSLKEVPVVQADFTPLTHQHTKGGRWVKQPNSIMVKFWRARQ